MSTNNQVGTREDNLWWQTALHVVAGLLIFGPALKVVAVVLMFMITAVRGDDLTVYSVAIISGVAAFVSLWLPTIFLKRSNTGWAGGIWGILVLGGLAFLMFAGTNSSALQENVFAAVGIAGAVALFIFVT